MEKNEAFRNKVLSRLYGLPEPNPSDVANTESGEDTTDENKEKEEEEIKEEEKTVGVTDGEKEDKDNSSSKKEESEEKETLESVSTEEKKDIKKEEEENIDNENETAENSVSSEASLPVTSASVSENNNSSSATTTTSPITKPPTTTTSHLYTVLMAPLDSRGSSIYPSDKSARSSGDETEGQQKKRIRLDESNEISMSEQTQGLNLATRRGDVNANNSVGMDLSKTQTKKLKKKRRKHLLSRLEVQRAKDFIYSSENEQFTVEKLRTMIEDVTEFLDAIWDVYCSEARLKGTSVEEEGYRAAAVIKCLCASGEGSWADLQLLSRAKSVLVLRSKNLAASTILRVENELGYDSDIRAFIVRMLRFWMDEIVNKG